jgi:hypothetical protein
MSCLDGSMDESKLPKRPIEDRAYSNIVTFLEGLASFHPEMVSDLGPKQRQILSDYYWFGREIDIDDIFRYRRALVAQRPEVKQEAERMLGDFFRTIGVTKNPSDHAAWS